MMDEINSVSVSLWHWLKANDLPNWISVVFTAVIWPVALIAWNGRRVHNVAMLELHPRPGEIQIYGKSHVAVALDFTNHTKSLVYLTGLRIKPCSATFPVSVDVRRDMATGTHDLSFLVPHTEGVSVFKCREMTLQTGTTSTTAVGVERAMPEEFYRYKPPRWRRWLRIPKYFVLEYTALVGSTRYRVRTVC